MNQNNRGFTLVEVMVVAVISAVILFTVTSLFITGVQVRIKSENERDAQIQTQKTLFMITDGERGGDRAGIRQAVEVIYGAGYVALAAYDTADDMYAYTYYRSTPDNRLYFNKSAYSPPLTESTTGGDLIASNVTYFNVYSADTNKYVVQLNTAVSGAGLTREITLNSQVVPRNTVIEEIGANLINTKAGCPDIVTNFVYAPGPGRVTLTWDPSTSPDVSGYNVYYRLASDSSYDKWNSSLITGLTTTITGLTTGQTYYFTVEAVDPQGDTSFKTFTYGVPN